MAANVFTIAASAPFAEILARGLIARLEAERDPLALASATVFLPTRRAARTLNETFARLLGGAALLPVIRPLGDVDEDEALFDGIDSDLTMMPAIAPLRRRLLLAAMVRRWDRAKRDGRLTFAQAAALSRSLSGFMDEAETQGADLSKLEELAPAALAEHWSEVRDFLALLRDEWPGLLDAEHAMNPAAHRNVALAALARRIEENPPTGPVIAAGSTGSIPATAELLKVISRLPNGSVILPGLDRDLDETSWNGLDAGHPQFGLKQLLARMEVSRSEVRDFEEGSARNPARETLLREALRPAPTTDAWRALSERGSETIAQGLDGLALLETAHQGEEAAAIALILREALETPGRTAALVTPDRGLARRVAAEMTRWTIAIDDSAGSPLANTPPGMFLCLLAEAAAAGFAPVPLLALLKHPLAAGGQAASAFRRKARDFDRFCLRGPRPDAGLAGIHKSIEGAIAEARGEVEIVSRLLPWFERLAAMLQPLADAFAAREVGIDALLDAHVAMAEALAATDDEKGADRLWRGDAGGVAANFVAELKQAAVALPDIETSSYPVLFRALAEERAVRPPYGRHPRLAILGPLEARLQSFDTIVLGGLNEGTWPASVAADPWLSRPMRAALGLEPPERHIGLAAHDFATLAAAPRVVLSRPQKVQGAPAVASRWLQRLVQLTKGLNLNEKLSGAVPYGAIAAQRDEPERAPKRMHRPRPCPPVAARPRGLSVTEIETWLRDPYAIYAKHVLRLYPLDALDAEIGPLERGSAIHAALERFLLEFGGAIPQGADLRLIAIADEIFGEAGIPKAAMALWRPRFIRAARWFVKEERARRAGIRHSFVEIKGERKFPRKGGEFTLRARADRIDVLTRGGAAIVDYKSGTPPTPKQMKTLLTPQLPLEGAILAAGGFAEPGALAPAELIYIRFSGGAEPGKTQTYPGDVAALVAEAEARLMQRIRDFDDPATPYLPRLIPFRADMAGDYDHLSRVREWSLTGWEEDEE
ncbi:MAG TPA: double-strand break repair protein AddB [Rhizomicrobium sp.]|jgi:ATP-dependent helicase/nuclease subunit B